MSDKKQRKRMLRKIKKIWAKHPMLRLGQLLECAKFPIEIDTFYVEDSVVEAGLDRFLKGK